MRLIFAALQAGLGALLLVQGNYWLAALMFFLAGVNVGAWTAYQVKGSADVAG